LCFIYRPMSGYYRYIPKDSKTLIGWSLVQYCKVSRARVALGDVQCLAFIAHSRLVRSAERLVLVKSSTPRQSVVKRAPINQDILERGA